MKNSLQNLLIFLALCLCGLVAFQWHRETKLRQELQSTSEDGRSKAETIQNLQKNLRFAEEEVKRLGNLRSGIAATAESNRIEIGALKKQFETAKMEFEKSAKQVEAFKSALQQANDNIQRQNESVKKLADERNDAVVKFNALVEKYNDLVNKWNAQPAAATNEPPKK
jgi:chromosome segregation ATPase